MRRFPLSCLAVVAFAGGALAEETDRSTDEQAFGPKAYLAPDGAAAAAAPAGAPVAPAAKVDVKPAATIDEKAVDKKEDKFPLSFNVGLSNSVSNAWLAPTSPEVDVPINGGSDTFTVPSSPGMMQPNLSTSLSLSQSASLPKLADWMPKMGLNGGMSFSIANWFPASGNGGAYDRQIRMSDLGLGLSLPALYKEEFTGISVSPGIRASVPLSISSRQSNLATSLSLSVPFGWTGPEWSWGQIGVNYNTSVRASLYTADAPTIPCEAAISVAGVVQNPLENGDIPLAYAREAEIAPNGECLLRGRQGIANLNNGVSASWSLGDHSVSASLSYAVGFLRPLANRPDLASENASGQNFNETSSGNLSYSYKVPVDFNMNVSAGIGSSQSIFVYDEASQSFVPRFPFYDFLTPANGFSSAFVDLSIGL